MGGRARRLTHAREADGALRRRELLPRRLLQPDLVDHSRELVPVEHQREKWLVCVSKEPTNTPLYISSPENILRIYLTSSPTTVRNYLVLITDGFD